MEFPNLNDTKFPNLENIDVWKYRNNFDYARWEANVTIRMVNVPWNADYTDVVKFAPNEERDAWFDALEGDSVTMTTMMRIKSDGTVKVPVPFDVTMKYNYLYVVNPIMTSFDAQIAFENLHKRMDRKHYFIINNIMLSPNATQLELQPDIWTNYINECEIPYMFLGRGHAPVAASDTDKFLANPMQNCEYLLTDDITLQSPNKVSYSEMHPVNAGTPYFCFASTVTPNQIASIGTLSGQDTWGTISYSDRDIRWGYQQNVSGYEWGNTSASGAIGANATYLSGNTPSVAVYGMPLNVAINNMAMLESYVPYFVNTIVAAFILGSDMITIGTKRTIAGVDVYDISGKQSSFNITFTKEMFGYPKEYERFAKLYTSQYATVEVSDNNNQSITIKIENTDGGAHASVFSNIAYPLLNFTAIFEGIGSSQNATFTWQGAQNSVTYGDIAKHMLKFNVPVYALYQSALNDWRARNAYANAGRRARAIANYQNSVGAFNETKEDTDDSQDTMQANVARTGACNVSNMADSMATHVTNVGNTGAMMNSNQAVANAANSAIYSSNRSAAYNSSSRATQKLATDNAADITASETVTEIQNNMTAITASYNSAAALGSGVVSGTASFSAGIAASFGMAEIASPIATGTAQIINAGITSTNIESTSTITQSTNSALTAASISNTTAKGVSASGYAAAILGYEEGAKYDNTNTTNSSNATQTANTVNTNNTNAANDQTTNNGNTSRTASKDNTNAAATASTEKSNASYDRLESVEGAKRTLEAERYPLYYEHLQASLNSPVQLGIMRGQDNGSEQATMHHMRMEGMQVRIKTPELGRLRQVGDYFARFGYNIEQVWSAENLQVMKHFTYWRAREIWINDGSGTNGIAQIIIGSIFRNGVTVWSNPEEIGRVNIYAN